MPGGAEPAGSGPAGSGRPEPRPAPTRPAGHDRRRALGAAGEDRAARWYEAAGYEVLDRNWSCRDGELDLVVRRGPTLVFCEVKARSGRSYGEPFEAVTRTKQARIRRLAARWLRERSGRLVCRPRDIRFDVASVLGPHVEILEDAF